jgi:hypothetical protein
MFAAIGRLLRRLTARRLNAEIAANQRITPATTEGGVSTSGLPPLALDLYERWKTAKGTGDLPLWQDISSPDLTRWQDNLVIIDIREGGKYYYQYYGRVFQDLFDQDMTGKYTTDIPQQQRIMIELEYNHCLTQRGVVSRVYTADFGGTAMTWHRTVMPVSFTGRSVDKLLIVAYQIGSRRMAAN